MCSVTDAQPCLVPFGDQKTLYPSRDRNRCSGFSIFVVAGSGRNSRSRWAWKTTLSGSAIQPFHRMGKRSPSAFADTFSRCPQAGGLAVPLTAGPAHDSSPVWSPDGKLIAFASDRYGHYDIFVTSAQGGTTRRLTTYSTDAVPTSFTPDGQFILFDCLPDGLGAEFPLPGQDLPATLQGIDSGRTRGGNAFDHSRLACPVRPRRKPDPLRRPERLRRSVAKT